MDDKYIFDEPIECIYRAIRGLDRMNFNGTESEALDILQGKFSSYSRDDLQEIYRSYGDVQNFEI